MIESLVTETSRIRALEMIAKKEVLCKQERYMQIGLLYLCRCLGCIKVKCGILVSKVSMVGNMKSLYN